MKARNRCDSFAHSFGYAFQTPILLGVLQFASKPSTSWTRWHRRQHYNITEEEETQQLRGRFDHSFLCSRSSCNIFVDGPASSSVRSTIILVHYATVVHGRRYSWHEVTSGSKSPTRGLEGAAANDASGAVEDSRLAPIGFAGEDDVQLFWWIFSLAR